MAQHELSEVPQGLAQPPVEEHGAEPPRSGARATTFAPLRLFTWKRLPLTLLVVLLALVCVRLGFWQLARRAQRLASNAQIAQRLDAPPVPITGPVANPEQLAFRYAAVSGSFDYDHEIIVLQSQRDDQPGVQIVTPLRIAGSPVAVLVDRGWIPDEDSSPARRKAYRGPATVQIRGLVHLPATSTASAAPSAQPAKRLDAWPVVDIPRLQQQMPYRLLPFYLEQAPAPGAPDLPWQNATVMLDEGPHLGYAVQWFTFAVVLVVGYVVVVGRRPRVEAATTPN